jgi:two-component system probable response regulator PhcQ
MMRRILLVDDEINVLNALVRAMRLHLRIEDLKIETFTDPFDALTRCSEVTFDIVISDFQMPQMTGVEFLHAIKDVAPTTVRMILSASTEFQTVTSAISEAQVFRYIPKPWQVGDLQENIRLALVHRDGLLEQQRLTDALRAQAGQLSPQEQEAKLLEEDEPGLLKVKWGPNGEILM